MELWIRSQEKESLLKIENISIDNENWILGNLISDDNKSICDYWKLGHYETKERALEILDEIDERIMLLNTFSIAKDRDTLLALKNALPEEKLQGLAYPYEMPKE